MALTQTTGPVIGDCSFLVLVCVKTKQAKRKPSDNRDSALVHPIKDGRQGCRKEAVHQTLKGEAHQNTQRRRQDTKHDKDCGGMSAHFSHGCVQGYLKVTYAVLQ